MVLATLRELTDRLEQQAIQSPNFQTYLDTALQALGRRWSVLSSYRLLTIETSKSSKQWIFPIVSPDNEIQAIEFNQLNKDDHELREVVQLWTQAVSRAWRSRHPEMIAASLNERLRLFESLALIVQEVWNEMASTEVLVSACQKIVETFDGIDSVGIVLNDNAPRNGTVIAAFPADGIGQQIQLTGNWIYEHFKSMGTPIVVDDVSQAHEQLGENQRVLMNFGIKSVMVIPLFAQEELIGSIGFDARQKPHHFTADEIDVLSAVAVQIAAGLQNVQLFNALQQNSTTQHLINQVVENLPLRSDLNTLLRTTGEKLGHMLGASQFSIHLNPNPFDSPESKQ